MHMPSNKPSASGTPVEHPDNAEYLASADLPHDHPRTLLPEQRPYYVTTRGSAYLGDSLALLRTIPSASTNLVLTSPPYALHFKKEYGNVAKDRYVDWFLPFAKEIHRILTDDGSFVFNIGGGWASARGLPDFLPLARLAQPGSFAGLTLFIDTTVLLIA